MLGAARWPTISSSIMLRFYWARNFFQNDGAKHGCDGAHDVGWPFLCVCVGLLTCRGTWVSAAKVHFNHSRQLWLYCLSVQREFTWAQQACCPSCLLHLFSTSFKTKSSVQNSALYLTLKPKLCLEYLSNPLQINFLATGTLAAAGFHSALPTPVHLLKYSSCFSWSRWCMCFINVSHLLHYWLYLSFELLNKVGCA